MVARALTLTRTWVRYGGRDAAPVTTTARCPRSAISWRVVHDRCRVHERALEVVAYASSEPGPGGEPPYERLDVREVMWDAARATDRAWAAMK